LTPALNKINFVKLLNHSKKFIKTNKTDISLYFCSILRDPGEEEIAEEAIPKPDPEPEPKLELVEGDMGAGDRDAESRTIDPDGDTDAERTGGSKSMDSVTKEEEGIGETEGEIEMVSSRWTTFTGGGRDRSCTKITSWRGG
jgi:hypothetical protein